VQQAGTTRARTGFGGFWRSLQHEFGELLGGVGEGEALAWSVVEFVGDGVELGFGDGAEVGALGPVLAQQPVGVLVGAALPYVPTATAASAMNSPACSAAQNGCTASGTWALKNRAIHFLLAQTAEGGQRRRPTRPRRPARASIGRHGSPHGLASAPTDTHRTKPLGRSLCAPA
jgi:hypothetical protein